MAAAIHLKKAKMEHFMDGLAHGKPIAPVDGNGCWTVNDMLALAGALCASAFSRGPQAVGPAALNGTKVPKQYRTGDKDALWGEIEAAVEFYAAQACRIARGEYDSALESEVKALVLGAAERPRTLVPLSGFKDIKALGICTDVD